MVFGHNWHRNADSGSFSQWNRELDALLPCGIPGEETVGMGYGYQAWQPDWDRDPSAWDYDHVSHGHGTWEGPEAARVKVS